MYYIVTSEKTFDQVSNDLQESVKELGFGILHVHNLGDTLRNKGVNFKEQCNIFEVCNPKNASAVLSVDMRLNMALPCRISVFTEKGVTKLGLIKPAQILAALSDDPELRKVAEDVEAKVIQMVEKAR